jgi:hypothetical protein
MAMTVEERKVRRQEGMTQMTFVRKIHRALVNGRPPASEFKTPLAAVTAARTLYSDLERKLTAEGMKPKPGELGVGIGYIPPDLSFLGHSPLYEPRTENSPGNETALMACLNGNIMLGLVFGIVDPDADSEEDRLVVGTRSFIKIGQTDEWLSELVSVMRIVMNDGILDREIQKQS